VGVAPADIGHNAKMKIPLTETARKIDMILPQEIYLYYTLHLL
jgi:hypothetical protein